jgi:hypothetical protein
MTEKEMDVLISLTLLFSLIILMLGCLAVTLGVK